MPPSDCFVSGTFIYSKNPINQFQPFRTLMFFVLPIGLQGIPSKGKGMSSGWEQMIFHENILFH
jgi:hypothetical protein